MSVEAMAYVWNTALNGAQKLMLLAIADRADEKGVCYPGIEKLATKCGIKTRAAQHLITKLEQLGELVVEIAGGTKTASGKTNRYYMKKYRDTLGIETPAFGSRGAKYYTSQGVQNFAPEEGVQNITPHGVQSFTPNTTEDTTDKKITTLTPAACALSEIKIHSIPAKSQITELVPDLSVLPKVNLTDKDLNKKARAIITTYLKVSGVIKSNAYAVWAADAKQLVMQGIDNKQVAKFVAEKQKEPFFADKTVSWNIVTSQIVTWVRAYEKVQARLNQPDLHEQMGVKREDFGLDLYDSPFDLKYPDGRRASA